MNNILFISGEDNEGEQICVPFRAISSMHYNKNAKVLTYTIPGLVRYIHGGTPKLEKLIKQAINSYVDYIDSEIE